MVVQLLLVNPSNQLIEKLFSVIEEAGDKYLVQQLGFQHGTSLGFSVCALLLKMCLKKLRRHRNPSTIGRLNFTTLLIKVKLEQVIIFST